MATNKDFKVSQGLVTGAGITALSGSLSIQHGSAQYSAFRGATSQSANLVIQSDGGNGPAYWISAKQSNGTLHIGGNGGTEPALGALVITAAGNIGVGTTSPGAYGAAYACLAVNGSTGGIFDSMSGGARAASMFTTGSEARLDAFGSRPWNFYTNSIERMRIDAAGNVGVGTTAPVVGTGFPVLTVGTTRPISLVSGLGGSSVYGSALTVNMAISTATGTPTATIGSGTSQQGGSAIVTDYSGQMTFHLYNTTVETGGTRTVNLYDITRMRIDSAGDVQIGAVTNPFGGRLLVQKATGTASIDVYNVSTGEAKIKFFNANNNSGIGGGSGGELRFYGNSADTERMRMDTAGNFVIGNTAAAAKLDVYGIAAAGAQAILARGVSDNTFQLFVRNGAAGSAAGTRMFTLGQEYNGSGLYVGLEFLRGGGATDGMLALWAGAAERMRLFANGNVSVGTASDTGGRLNVDGNGAVALMNFNAAGNNNFLRFQHNGTAVADIGTGNSIISGGSSADFGMNSRTGVLVFSTAQTERMRVNNGGGVQINTTLGTGMLTVAGTNSGGGLGSGEQVLSLRNTIATASARGAGIRFDMGSYTSGAAQIDLVNTGSANDGNLSFSTRSSGTIAERMVINVSGVTVYGTLTESSTIRVKENVRDLEGSLDKVLALRGVQYDMKDGSASNQIGLIAEEVHTVVPNVVYRDEDGDIAGLQYARLVALLIEGMKTQEARIKHLEALVAKLVD